MILQVITKIPGKLQLDPPDPRTDAPGSADEWKKLFCSNKFHNRVKQIDSDGGYIKIIYGSVYLSVNKNVN
jgi:hypothetical protein